MHNRKFGILGGGFGLYGWLPAIARVSSEPVVTLAAYRQTICDRPELRQFSGRCQYVDREIDVISGADTLVLAKRPIDQLNIVRKSTQDGWAGNFVLEKPLAPIPAQAHELLSAIRSNGNGLAVGFSLFSTEWGKAVVSFLRSGLGGTIQIKWQFLAHHYLHSHKTWKRHSRQGGGALSFYAIHLLGLLSHESGWRVSLARVPRNRPADASIDLQLVKDSVNASIACDSVYSDAPRFSCHISVSGKPIFDFVANTPFDEIDTEQRHSGQMEHQGQDQRVPALSGILLAADAQHWAIDPVVTDHIDLWERTRAALANSNW